MKPENIIYLLDLNEQNTLKINSILEQNKLIKSESIKSLIEISQIIHDGKLTFLVLKYKKSTNADLEFILKNNAFFLTVNLIIIIENDLNISELAITNYSENFKTCTTLSLESSLIDIAVKFSDFIANDTKANTNPVYLAMDFKIFSNISKAPCDIYIKLSDTKFVKILSDGDDQQPSQVISKYTVKGVVDLYIKSSDIDKFKEKIKSEIFSINPEKNHVAQKILITESVIGIARDFGISEYIVEGINDTFLEVSNDLADEKKLDGILKMVKDAEGSIIANHSYLTAVFATLICTRTNWATIQVRKNICLASILHDIELTTSPFYMHEFKSLEEINKLDSKSASKFKEHGTHLAEALSKNSSIPNDAINLIAKHHLGSKGNSYPNENSSSQLSPPNCLFNVAHQLSIELCKVNFNFEKSNLAFERLRKHYSGGAMFNTFIDILEKELEIKKIS
jgi:HD-GYP domain-containing protein (c-di-GMP phosphodiesterase class II)